MPSRGDEPDMAGVSCFFCGYSLQGLQIGAACPECGGPIDRPLDPETTRSLLGGLRFVFWLTIAQLGLGFALGAVFGVLTALSGAASGQPNQQFVNSYTLWLSIFSVTVNVLLLAAWWRITKPIPSIAPEYNAPRARNGVRFTMFVSLVLAIAATVRLIVNPPQAIPPPQPGQAFSIWNYIRPDDLILGAIGLLISALLISMQALYLRFVSRRLQGRAGLELADTCVWLVPLLATVGLLACGLGPIAALVLVLVLMGIQINALKRSRLDAPGPRH